jgi:glyoxylase-like metal-dependent hydrolase (beta-lactamase superfamily II)
MRDIDLLHMGREKVIGCWEVDDVLVDPGPQTCEATLLEAIGGERPRALLLTHIHLDHSGVAGSLVRRWPDLRVYVHELGAPHLIDPSKLVVSVARLQGEEEMRTLWGEVAAVPEANLRVISGGESILDGAFRVEYTPGHASHHVSYLHEETGTALVGDVAGVRIPPSGFTLAPTPPPDIDVEAWGRSLDLVEAWEPDRLALAHFGEATDPEAQLEAVRESLAEQARLVETTDQAAFERAIVERIEANAGEAGQAYLQIAPTEHLYLGLERWRRKREEARGAA